MNNVFTDAAQATEAAAEAAAEAATEAVTEATEAAAEATEAAAEATEAAAEAASLDPLASVSKRLQALEEALREREVADAASAAGLPAAARNVISRMSGSPAHNAAMLKALLGEAPPNQTINPKPAGYGLFQIGR